MRKFAEWLEENDTGIRPYYGYSGRGMFGDTCFGVVGDPNGIQGALMDFAYDCPAARGAVGRIVKNQRRDSLGKGMIVYFPGVDIPKPEGESTKGE